MCMACVGLILMTFVVEGYCINHSFGKEIVRNINKDCDINSNNHHPCEESYLSSIVFFVGCSKAPSLVGQREY